MILTQSLIVIIFIGIFASVTALIKKSVLNNLTALEFLLITFFLEFFLMGMLLVFLGDIPTLLRKIKTKITGKEIISLGIFSLVITGLSYGSVWIHKREDVSKITPLIAIISTLLTFGGGIFVFKEKVQIKDYIAIVLMITGIGLMGWK